MKFKKSKLLLSIFFLFSFVIIFQEKVVHAQNPCEFPVFPGGRKFSSNNNYSPYAVTVGDVNNDGKLDIVTANYTASDAQSGSINVYLGTGTGDFSSIKSFNADPFPVYLSLGDLNDDGNLDAIVYSPIKDEIRILLGDGAGNFSLLTRYPFHSPRKVKVVDVNEDGKVDLFVSGGNSYSAKVSVFPGNGNGTFAASIDTSFSSGNPLSFAVDDFNSDGKIDFATVWSSRVSIWLGDGAGHFVMDWTTNQAEGEIVKGNLNNDNYIDLAVGGDGYVKLLFGKGDGTFQVGERINTDGQGAGSETKIADLNHDGWNDIVKLNFGDDDVSISLGIGNGRFALAKNQPLGYRPQHIEIGDFNADSYPDAVVTSSTSANSIDATSLTLGKGDGTFIAPTKMGLNPNSLAFAVADINSDGKDDIVSANWGSPGISLFLNKLVDPELPPDLGRAR